MFFGTWLFCFLSLSSSNTQLAVEMKNRSREIPERFSYVQ